MDYWFAALLTTIAVTTLFLCYIQFQSNTSGPQLAKANPLSENVLEVRDDLLAALPHAVLDRSDKAFMTSIQSMWAGPARDPVPALIVLPRNTAEVSAIIGILHRRALTSQMAGSNAVQFAIRSGGHSPVREAASINDGIVLDLSQLNSIECEPEKNLVTIGTGARWRDVYSKLDALGLGCAGGRDGGVGVGGFLLGGGLSFFSSKVGFACDQVVSYEVILANGQVIKANADGHHDLAKALRGGGNNFGIVTKFTLSTFSQGKVWAGYIYYWPSSAENLLKGYHSAYNSDTDQDEQANCIMALVYVQSLGCILPVAGICYTAAVVCPPALGWTLREKRIFSDLKIRTVTEATELTASKSRSYERHRFQTTTFEDCPEMLLFVASLLKNIKQDMKQIRGLLYSISFQPLVPSATKFEERNIMGVKTKKTLTILLISSYWKCRQDDQTVASMSEDFIARTEAKAKEIGVYHPYKYANYCAEGQDPYSGIEDKSFEVMRKVSEKYDPIGLFSRKGVPGGFKIDINKPI